MATVDFKDDVNVALRKFINKNGLKRPSVLKVVYEDAWVWLGAAPTHESPSDFVKRVVEPYVRTLRLNGQLLEDCRVELLKVDSGEETRFE
jgi:hypothetical protein